MGNFRIGCAVFILEVIRCQNSTVYTHIDTGEAPVSGDLKAAFKRYYFVRTILKDKSNLSIRRKACFTVARIIDRLKIYLIAAFCVSDIHVVSINILNSVQAPLEHPGIFDSRTCCPSKTIGSSTVILYCPRSVFIFIGNAVKEFIDFTLVNLFRT